MDTTLQEVTIDLVQARETERYFMLLHHLPSQRVLPMWIGAREASAIQRARYAQPGARPFPPELTLNLLHAVNAQVQHVVIHALAENRFRAEVIVVHDTHQQHVDARPSDAVALALQAKVPIYVMQPVLDTLAVAEGDPMLHQFA